MHLDTMYHAHRLEADLHAAQLERAREAKEATDSTTGRPGLVLRIQQLFGRAGTRLQAAPEGTSVKQAKPGAALS